MFKNGKEKWLDEGEDWCGYDVWNLWIRV